MTGTAIRKAETDDFIRVTSDRPMRGLKQGDILYVSNRTDKYGFVGVLAKYDHNDGGYVLADWEYEVVDDYDPDVYDEDKRKKASFIKSLSDVISQYIPDIEYLRYENDNGIEYIKMQYTNGAEQSKPVSGDTIKTMVFEMGQMFKVDKIASKIFSKEETA